MVAAEAAVVEGEEVVVVPNVACRFLSAVGRIRVVEGGLDPL